MKHLKKIMAICLAFSFWGCAAVYVKSPVGEKPVILNATEWEGKWIGGGEAVVSVKVIDSLRGILQTAVIEYELENKVRLDTETVYLREWKRFLFVSIPARNDNQGDGPLFFWARLQRDDERIVFWLPDHSKIKALVEAGKLPGTIEKNNDVVLGDLQESHLEILTSEKEGVLYQWENPGVLVRVLFGKEP